MEGRDDKEAQKAEAPWQEEHPNQAKLDDERGERYRSLESVRELLRVPANPIGQGAVLVVMVGRSGSSTGGRGSPL